MTPPTGGSLQLLRLFGIPVRVHFTFLFVVMWVGLYAASAGQSAALAFGLLAGVFASVVVHELGHALAAARCGIKTHEIVIHPLGGLARLDRAPSGMAELVIASAGPAANFLLAGGLFALTALLGSPFEISSAGGVAALPAQLLIANVLLGAVNLLPAYPLDGGRILRAFLSFLFDDERATRLVAAAGQGLAILIALFALFGPGRNLVLLLVALFIFVSAGQEAAVNRTRALLRGRVASEAMITRFEKLAPQESLEWATRLFLATHQRDFPVVDAWGRVAGLLDRNRLLVALESLGKDAAVLDAMDRTVQLVPADAPLNEVLRQMQGAPSRPILVGDEEQGLIGVLTLEKLTQFSEVIRRL